LQFGQRKIQLPFVNFVSASVAVDSKERIWGLSYERQLKYEEMGFTFSSPAMECVFIFTMFLTKIEEIGDRRVDSTVLRM
jgi:hypothetical protein